MGMEKKMRRAKKIALFVAAILVINLILSFVITKLVYDSVFDRYVPQTAEDCLSDLTDCREDTSFYSGDNLLKGQYLDSEGDSLVIVAHGINSAAAEIAPLAEKVFLLGYDVFVFDMTGSGESEGESAVGFCQSVLDLRAAIDHAEESFEYEKLFLLGHSRGGYGAVCVLESHEEKIDGVIAVSAPNSAMDAIIAASVDKVGFLAYGNYPMLYIYQVMLFGSECVSLSCDKVIDDTSVPVMIIHGKDDGTIPADRFSAYSHKGSPRLDSAELLEIDGDHTSVLESRELTAAIDSFFKDIEKGGE